MSEVVMRVSKQIDLNDFETVFDEPDGPDDVFEGAGDAPGSEALEALTEPEVPGEPREPGEPEEPEKPATPPSKLEDLEKEVKNAEKLKIAKAIVKEITKKKKGRLKKRDEIAQNETDQWYDDIVDFQNQRESIEDLLRDNSR